MLALTSNPIELLLACLLFLPIIWSITGSNSPQSTSQTRWALGIGISLIIAIVLVHQVLTRLVPMPTLPANHIIHLMQQAMPILIKVSLGGLAVLFGIYLSLRWQTQTSTLAGFLVAGVVMLLRFPSLE